MSQFQDLYAKVISDPAFRLQLVNEPAVALESVGITATPEILAAVDSVVTAVEDLGEDLGGLPATTDVLGTACVS